MDTSETYIKMCEKAEEIQKLKPIWQGDSPDFYFGENQEVYEIGGDFFAYKALCPWLPRQDQLQEMIHTTDWISTLEKFSLFAFGDTYTYSMRLFSGMGIPHNVFSMEQLWLAFVMKEKYNKIWDGEQWTIINL